jgi:hypothetical protein
MLTLVVLLCGKEMGWGPSRVGSMRKQVTVVVCHAEQCHLKRTQLHGAGGAAEPLCITLPCLRFTSASLQLGNAAQTVPAIKWQYIHSHVSDMLFLYWPGMNRRARKRREEAEAARARAQKERQERLAAMEQRRLEQEAAAAAIAAEAAARAEAARAERLARSPTPPPPPRPKSRSPPPPPTSRGGRDGRMVPQHGPGHRLSPPSR